MFSSEPYSKSALLDFAREAMSILVPGLELSHAVVETKFKEVPNKEERTRYGKKEIGYEFIEYAYFGVGPSAIVNGYGLPENTSLELRYYGTEVALDTTGDHAPEVAKAFEARFRVATEEILDDLVSRAPGLLQYGNWGRAQEIARTILQCHPGNPTGLLVLGFACAAVGEQDEARKAFAQLNFKESRNVDALSFAIPKDYNQAVTGKNFSAALEMVIEPAGKPAPRPASEKKKRLPAEAAFAAKTPLPAKEDALKNTGTVSIANCEICRTLTDSASNDTQKEKLLKAFTDLLLVATNENRRILKCPQCSTYYEHENESLTRLVPTDAMSRLAVLHKNELLRLQLRTEVLLQDLAHIVVDVNDLLLRPYAARSLIRNLPGATPAEKLLAAIAEGNTEKIQAEIKGGADINHRDRFGLAPILYASMFGSANVVQLLLQSGADPHIADQNGWMPLMFAILSGEKFARIAICLLDAGVDPNIEPSALKAAVRAENIAAIEVLKNYGADPTAKGKDGQSAIDLAAAASDPRIKETTERHTRYKGSRPAFVTVKSESLKTQGEDTSWQQIPETPLPSVQQIAVSSGKTLLASSTANEVLIWDLAEGRLLHVLSGHHPIAYSPDGKRLAYTLRKSVVLRDLENRKEAILAEHSSEICAIAFSASGMHFASADSCEIRMQELSGKERYRFQAPDGITCLSFREEERVGYGPGYGASGGGNGRIRLWNISSGYSNSGQQVEELKYHGGPVAALHLADRPYRNSLISVDGDRIKILQISQGYLSHVFATPSEIRAITIRDTRMASGGSDGCVHLWDLFSTIRCLRTVRAGSPVNSVAISSDHRYFIAGCDDGIIRLWDEVSGRLAGQFLYFGDGRWAALTADGCYNASPETVLPGKTMDPEGVRSFLSLETGSKTCRCHLYTRRGSEFNPEKEKEWIDIVKLEEGEVPFLNNDYEWKRWHCVCKICSKRWFVTMDELSHEPTTWKDVTLDKEYDWVFEPKTPSGLFDAATNGDEETIKRLLAEGVDVDERSYTPSPVGMKATALMFAVYYGQERCMELLLEAGADPNAKSADGDTPLIVVARKREDFKLAQRLRDEGIDLRLAQMLLQKGADPAVKNNKGETALPLACHFRYDLELVKLLAEAAGPKAITDPKVMHNALHPPHKETIELLLDLGVDVNAPTWMERTPLMDAVSPTWLAGSDMREELAELLLKRGADVNARDSSGNTALIDAAQGKSASGVLTLLLRHGADVNAKNEKDETALNVASFGGYKDSVEVLLANGADVDVPNSNGLTPLISAAGYGKNVEVIKLLLDHGANLEVVDTRGGTPLIVAAKSQREELVKLLLDRGARIDAKNCYGRTALLEAAGIKGSEKMVEILIHHGADVNMVDSGGETALMNAAWCGSLPIVKLFLKHNANTSGALEKANRYNHRAVAELIRNYKSHLPHSE